MHPTILHRLVLIHVFVGLLVVVACGGPDVPEVLDPAWDGPVDMASRYPAVNRLVAIGDLHGDLEAARKALGLAGAVDENDRWIGGDLTIVQTGDVLDRGDDAVEILELFDDLTEQARAVGGAIHLLNGNHELMNVKLDMRYVSVGGFIDFLSETSPDSTTATAQDVVEGVAGRILAMRPGGVFALRFAERNTVSIVGETVFAHGGVLPHIADYGIDRLNQETRDWIRGDRACRSPLLLAADGPVWSRHYSDDPDGEDCRLLDITLEKLGAKRMVVGHTVQEEGISSACDGRVWRIDVGMAEHYGGGVAVLELSEAGVRVLGS